MVVLLLRHQVTTPKVAGVSGSSRQCCADLQSSLIIAEHKDSRLSPATRNAAAAATQLKDVSETTMLVAGQNIGPVAEAASKVQGISHVLTADATCLQHQLAEPTAELIAAVQRKSVQTEQQTSSMSMHTPQACLSSAQRAGLGTMAISLSLSI